VASMSSLAATDEWQAEHRGNRGDYDTRDDRRQTKGLFHYDPLFNHIDLSIPIDRSEYGPAGVV
jgi:hypothetical protein